MTRYRIKLFVDHQIVEGHISVQSGALVVRKEPFDPPYLVIAAGSWSRAELITEEDA